MGYGTNVGLPRKLFGVGTGDFLDQPGNIWIACREAPGVTGVVEEQVRIRPQRLSPVLEILFHALVSVTSMKTDSQSKHAIQDAGRVGGSSTV